MLGLRPASNAPAIRAYEKAGWHDGLLMELVLG
jgi:hypothetical protein